MSDMNLEYVHYCPVIQTGVLVLGTVLSFAVAYARGDVSLYLPFISETGAYSPEKCFFSFGLIIGSIFGCISSIFFFICTRNNPLNATKIFSSLNKAALIIGLISMIGLAGVAAFPMTTVFWAHLVMASIYFTGNAIYFLIVSVITYKVENKSKKLKIRSSLSISIIVLLFLLVIIFPQSLMNWYKHNKSIPALKTPDQEGFTLILISSILEWSIVFIIIAFNLTLSVDLRNFKFEVLCSEATKTTTVVNNEGEDDTTT